MAVIAIHQAQQWQQTHAFASQTLAGWRWRQHDKQQEWTACTHSKPTTEIFTDLIDASRIPDPFLDENEKLVQWVGEKDWEYECSFTAAASAVRAARQVLVFDGLDTVVSVYLNNARILESDNMFHTHRVDVKKNLREGTNTLRIVFRSALCAGQALEAKLGNLTCFNGDSSRVHVRKAQYHYGWDWGPTFLTCGPYREIRLETYTSAALYDVFADAVVSDDLQQAKLDVSFTADTPKDVIVQATVTSPSGKIVQLSTSLAAGATKGSVSTTIPQPELWYPTNHGPQVFYAVSLQVFAASDTSSVVQSSTTNVGIRRVRLVQEPLLNALGTSFYFEVNNQPVYMSGSNWIPRHSFLTALTADDYRQSVDECVASNQNMLRVWGGGLYEHDAFYEQCDRKGVLVWQDFMFACGVYPCHDSFAQSVKREAEDQVRRLRRFCSVVLYAGNNEDYQVAENLNLEWDQNNNSGDWTATNFPARTLYERYLPDVVTALSPQVPYHPGSPWGGVNTEDATMGDIHQWKIWHGQDPYQQWPQLTGRFVSEFGMIAFPPRKSVERYVTDPAQRYPQSAVLDLHNKADGGERRLGSYILENLRLTSVDLDSWIYASQLMQAECLSTAIRSCRRQWKGHRREYCGGQLVWQINDCWPVSSWALIDFYGERKLAFYAVKRQSAQLVVDIGREYVPVESNTLDNLKERRSHVDVWAANSSLSQNVADVIITLFDIASGTVTATRTLKSENLGANETTELLRSLAVDNKTAVQAILRDAVSGTVLGRASDWPQPLKHVALAKPKDSGVRVTIFDGRVEITANVPIKGLELSVPTDASKTVTWADNGVDIFPGDVYSIDASGLSRTDTVDVRYYGL